MDFNPQNLVYYFQAAAGAVPLDPHRPGMYLVSEDDGDVVETIWSGREISGLFFVAPDARAGLPALYLLNESHRRVYYVDQANLLRCAQFQPDTEEWDESPLQNPDSLTVDPAGRLSGGFTPDGYQVVCFESRPSHISVIRIRDGDTGEWDALPALPAEIRAGAPHTAFFGLEGDADQHVLYVHRDGAIHWHRLQGSIEDGGWRDETLPGSSSLDSGSDRINNFLAIPSIVDEDGDLHVSFEAIVLTELGIMVRIGSDGQKTELGKVMDGKFTTLSSEECVVETMSLISGAIAKVAKKVKR